MKHHHTSLLVLALSISLLVVGLYMYMFHAMSVSVLRAAAARDVVATERYDQTQAKSLSTTVISTAADRARLSELFIPSDNIISFITSLESLGKETHTKLVLASIDADQSALGTPGAIGQVKSHVSVQGSWSNVMTLLALVERLPYASSINRVRFDPASTAEKGTLWDMSFDIQALVRVPDATLSSN